MISQRVFGAVALTALVVCGAAQTAAAQEQSASLEGRVVDPSGAVVPGAVVIATGAFAGAFSSVASADGRYWFPALPPGQTAVAVDITGFQPLRVELDLVLGSARRLDLELRPATVSQQVAVVAKAPSIDTLQSGSFRTIRGEVARLLPSGRDFSGVVATLPGANLESRLAGISIDGSSGAENRFASDGVDSTDVINGTSGKGLRTDFLGELQVKFSGYAAEYGGSTGGVLSVTLRSGTDQFHGDLTSYFIGDTWRGAPRPVLRRSPVASDRAEYVTYPDDDAHTWSPLVSLGGPIVRRSAWFFAGLEANRTTTSRTTTLVDGSRGSFEATSTAWNGVASIDWRPASGLRARGTANVSPSRSSGSLPAPVYGEERGTSNPLYPWASVGGRSYSGATSLQADYVVGAWLYVNARAGHYRDSYRSLGIPDDVKYTFSRTNIGLAGVPEALQRPGGFTNVATNSAAVRKIQERVTGSLAGTVHASWLGAHLIKAGVQYERYGNDVLEGDQNDWVILRWGLSYPATDGRLVRGTYGYYSYSRATTSGDVHGGTLGLFVQDAWRIGSRLTVDAGLRTERERIPSYDTSLGQAPIALRFGFAQKLAPRLGAAVDLSGDGRARLYASAGRYYDVFKLDALQAMFGGQRYIETFRTLDTPDWTTIAIAGQYPGQLIESLNYRYPFNAPDAASYGVGVEPNLRPFSQWETTVGYDQQLRPGVVAGLRYVRKGISRAIEDVGSVVPGVGEFLSLANPGFGIARTTEPTACGGPCPDQPRAVRDYDALEVRVARNPGGRWFGEASYVWSRLFGNYSGLANSDEGGRANPNWNRVFDALHASFDQQGKAVLGRLATDRPHQFKVNAVYQAPFGLSVGTRVVALSGAPEQVEASNLGVAFYPLGRGSLGRYPAFTQTDLLVQQRVALGRGRTIQVEMNVSNLFDQRTVTSRVRAPYAQSLNLDYARFFSGFDLDAEAARLRLAPNALFEFDGGYGPGASSFQGRRAVRFALRTAF